MAMLRRKAAAWRYQRLETNERKVGEKRLRMTKLTQLLMFIGYAYRGARVLKIEPSEIHSVTPGCSTERGDRERTKNEEVAKVDIDIGRDKDKEDKVGDDDDERSQGQNEGNIRQVGKEKEDKEEEEEEEGEGEEEIPAEIEVVDALLIGILSQLSTS